MVIHMFVIVSIFVLVFITLIVFLIFATNKWWYLGLHWALRGEYLEYFRSWFFNDNFWWYTVEEFGLCVSVLHIFSGKRPSFRKSTYRASTTLDGRDRTGTMSQSPQTSQADFELTASAREWLYNKENFYSSRSKDNEWLAMISIHLRMLLLA